MKTRIGKIVSGLLGAGVILAMLAAAGCVVAPAPYHRGPSLIIKPWHGHRHYRHHHHYRYYRNYRHHRNHRGYWH